MRCWIPALALVSACVESSSIICNGRVCPADSHCDEASGLCIPATCGNGVLDPSEDCEGTPTDDCTDYGYYLKGELACSPICTIDTSKCGATCGDRTINGPEVCDGIPPAGHTCADFGLSLIHIS